MLLLSFFGFCIFISFITPLDLLLYMQNSKNYFNAVAFIIFFINILFVLSWSFLKENQYYYDSSDKKHELSVLRNDGHLGD